MDNSISIQINFKTSRRCTFDYEATGPAVALKQRCLQDIVGLKQLVERLNILKATSKVDKELSHLRTIDIKAIKNVK